MAKFVWKLKTDTPGRLTVPNTNTRKRENIYLKRRIRTRPFRINNRTDLISQTLYGNILFFGKNIFSSD